MKQKNEMAFTPELVESLQEGDSEEKRDRTQKVFNLIILDESGSMAAIEKQAVSGLNETFQTISNAQKMHPEQEHYISFVVFNSAKIRTVMNRLPVDPSHKLEWNDYVPNDCTPLFDAMGLSLNELKGHVDKDDVALVTIITDGMENASRSFSLFDIKRLVASLKEKGWVFAYIGTNQDVDAVADDMGIRSRMHYDYSERGASDMFKAEQRHKYRFYDRLSREGKQFLMDEEFDYFSSTASQTEDPDEDMQATKDGNKQQNASDSGAFTEEAEESKGFWSKIKSIIKK